MTERQGINISQSDPAAALMPFFNFTERSFFRMWPQSFRDHAVSLIVSQTHAASFSDRVTSMWVNLAVLPAFIFHSCCAQAANTYLGFKRLGSGVHKCLHFKKQKTKLENCPYCSNEDFHSFSSAPRKLPEIRDGFQGTKNRSRTTVWLTTCVWWFVFC